MIRGPPRSTRTDTLFPYTTLLRSLDQMLARMDIITVHSPHTPATYHLLSARRLKLMPAHAILVNTARGEIIDEGALAARSEEHTSELQSLMRISYAVFCLKKKNITYYTPLYRHKHSKTTHHN